VDPEIVSELGSYPVGVDVGRRLFCTVLISDDWRRLDGTLKNFERSVNEQKRVLYDTIKKEFYKIDAKARVELTKLRTKEQRETYRSYVNRLKKETWLRYYEQIRQIDAGWRKRKDHLTHTVPAMIRARYMACLAGIKPLPEVPEITVLEA
jgi:hypothetical protein